MNWKPFKFTLAVLVLIIFTALAIPQFNFKIGETQVYYPNVDFSLIQAGSRTGNFLRGRDLYPSKEVPAILTFTSTEITESDKRALLEQYLAVVRSRVITAGLKDVEVRSEITNSAYALVLNFPDYYTNPIKYAKLLTGKGTFTFASFDSTGQTLPVDISDRDIQGTVSINFISQLGSHLQFQFSALKANIITQLLTPASASQVGFFLMDVDGFEQFFVRQYEQNDALTSTVRAIPTNYSEGEGLDKSIMLSIVRSYFLEKSTFADTFVVDENVTIVPSSFSPDGTQFITIMSFVSLLVLIVIAFIRLKLVGGLKFALMVGTFVAISITLLKYSNATLSVGTLLGMIVITGITVLITWKVIQERDEDKNELNYKKYLNLSFVLVLLTIFLSTIIKSISMFYDFTGVILIGGLVLALMNFSLFRIFNYLNIKRRSNV